MAEKLRSASEESIWNFRGARKKARGGKSEKSKLRSKRKGSGSSSGFTQVTLFNMSAISKGSTSAKQQQDCSKVPTSSAGCQRASESAKTSQNTCTAELFGNPQSPQEICSSSDSEKSAPTVQSSGLTSSTTLHSSQGSSTLPLGSPNSLMLRQNSAGSGGSSTKGNSSPESVLVMDTPPARNHSPDSFMTSQDPTFIPETPPPIPEEVEAGSVLVSEAGEEEDNSDELEITLVEQQQSSREDSEGTEELHENIPQSSTSPGVSQKSIRTAEHDSSFEQKKISLQNLKSQRQTSIKFFFSGQKNCERFVSSKPSRPSTSVSSSVTSVSGSLKMKENEYVQKTSGGRHRKCPFYKWISGTQWTVDAFRYGSIPGCDGYFLTHFHYDHYGGLNRHFNHRLYCSKITGNLVADQLKVSRTNVSEVAFDKPTVIGNAKVTFLDANHCPGAALILFELPSGLRHLHTGDFRASASLCSRNANLRGTIADLYLDTTYCDPAYCFPPQEKVIEEVVAFARNRVALDPNLLIVCGSYSVGKERIFIAIAEALGTKIFARAAKRRLLACFEDTRLDSLLTSDPTATNLHVVPMAELRTDRLAGYRTGQKRTFSAILGLRPTGWSHKPQSKGTGHIFLERKAKDCEIYGVPYSEHSSFNELRHFVRTIRPKRILPTVNVGSAQQRDKMNSFFKEWLADS